MCSVKVEIYQGQRRLQITMKYLLSLMLLREFPFNVNRVCERLDMLKREVGILGLLICLNAGALAEGMINPFFRLTYNAVL